jgi:uroporphyrin-3 C-methyltransferase
MVTETPSDFSASSSSMSALGRRASDASGVASPPLVSAPRSSRWWGVLWFFLAGMVALACALSLSLAWKAQRQVSVLEQALVRRQEASQSQAAEAQMMAKQAQETVRESAAKTALLEARVTEVAVQRNQLEELIQSLSRSRDENVVVDIEAAIRVALQQAAITGSAEPLVAVLKQSDERLARYNQPRLQGIRRAIVRDLDRVRATGVTDVGALTIRLDEAVRLVDELPLLSARRATDDDEATAVPGPAEAASAAASAPLPASPASTSTSPSPSTWVSSAWWDTGRDMGRRIWGEVRSLVRVSRIDHPDAVLLAPEQAFFLRENLKLRLLNARLALLSRQFDTAQADLTVVQDSIHRYFDPQSRRTGPAAEVVRQVAGQARLVGVPRPDDTLAALAAVEAGR